jgi:DNA repair exonuclease SbcCD ATPase subunit
MNSKMNSMKLTAVNELRKWVDEKKGGRKELIMQRNELRSSLISLKVLLENHEQARVVIREAGMETQRQLQYHISDIVTMALESIFETPYRFEVEFVERRNKSECDLYFSRDGMRVDPLEASGGGAVDVASFALRVASWTMEQPRSRNMIILDEPLKNLSKTYQDKGSELIKQLSERLGIQFIIVTHEPVLASYADKTFEVTIINGKSQVKEI